MSRNKTVLGIFVDGLDVKLAHLQLKSKKIIVQELKSATFASKLEERKLVAIGAPAFAEGDEGFGMSLSGGNGAEPLMEKSSSEDNNAVLLGLLASYPVSKYSLTYSISEPAIYYHQLESDFGLAGKKLKERVLDELKNTRAFQPAPDAVDYITTDEGSLLCVVREEGLTLMNSLENIKGFIGNRLPQIPSIDTSDMSLMNMVRMNYAFEPDEISVVIYVGMEFTRLIFLRGGHFHQFAPIISEGYDSPNLQNTVYSRLLLEQDNLAIQRISKIILAGECQRIGFREFLSQQLPDQDIEYLIAPQLDTSPLSVEQQEAISEYAIPIGAAWKVLAGSTPQMYNINLLPDEVREGQRRFKLSWHGYLLLALIFMSTLFFTLKIQTQARAVSDLEDVLKLKNLQVAENATLTNSINGLKDQIGRYKVSMALYDSLVPGADKWSKAMTQLSHGVDDLNSIWLADLSTNATGAVTMDGFAVYRTRIPRLSSLFENALLKEVNVQEIRDKTVYKYKIEVPASPAGQ